VVADVVAGYGFVCTVTCCFCRNGLKGEYDFGRCSWYGLDETVQVLYKYGKRNEAGLSACR
jgi:hypothetical protein